MANLNPDQAAAAKRLFAFIKDPTEHEILIQGPAGTGKSTLLKHVLEQMPKQEKLLKALGLNLKLIKNLYVTATTKKAAQVLSDMLNCPPLTIHSLLGLRVNNDRETGTTSLQLSRNAKRLTNALVIIDEASFINDELLYWIRARTDNCKVIYVGDQYQLLPTATSSCPVFSSDIPTISLTQIMRNQGSIQALSAQYRESVITEQFKPLVPCGVDIVHLEMNDYQTALNNVLTRPEYSPADTKILAWTNQRVHQYNEYVCALKGINDPIRVGEVLLSNAPIMAGNSTVLVGTDELVRITDVSQPYKEYDVVGRLVELNREIEVFVPLNRADVNHQLKTLAANKKWGLYWTIKEQWGDLRPAYACTVHKSQGSTYQTVFIDLNDIGRCNIPSDVARMLYVAISRASKKVILYGELPDHYKGVRNETQRVA